MKIPFRQGIVRHQTDIQGNQQFLLEQSDAIDLIAVNDPTIVTFAHKSKNYVITEKRSVPNAWVGPFVQGNDYWLYWDIDVKTGLRTFGHTTLEPTFGLNQPANPVVDQHWFNTRTNTMTVFNGASFKDRIRVFAAKYSNATLIESFSGGSVFDGTQIANSTRAEGGALIFDDADKPLKRGDGTFITTADEFSSGVASASNIKIEALTFEAKASANIAAYHIVYLNDFDSVLPASPLKIHNVPFGIIEEDAYVGELIHITTDGVICNPSWNWTEAGAELFIDDAGQITDVPSLGMLPIGYVLSPSEILLKTSGVTHVTIEGGIVDGGGSGAENLPELNDVDIVEPTNNQVLTYEDGEIGSRWVNRDLPPVSIDVSGLTDTVITNPQYGEVLSYQEGDIWVNDTLSMPQHNLASHVDVDTFSPQDGDVLTFIEGSWVNEQPTGGSGATTLPELNDVSVPTKQPGHTIVYRPDGEEYPAGWHNGFTPEIADDESYVRVYQNEVLLNAPNGFNVTTDGDISFTSSIGAIKVNKLESTFDIIANEAVMFKKNPASPAVGFNAPNVDPASSITWSLPNTEGVADQTLMNAGNGNLYWGTPTGGAGAENLPELNDVLLSEPVTGNVLMYVDGEIGSFWTEGTVATDLPDLNDVTVNTPTEGQQLVFRSGSWVNELVASAPSSYPKTFEATNEGVLSNGNMHYDNGSNTYGYVWTHPFNSGKTLYELDYSGYAGASAHYIGINDGGDPQNGGTTDNQVAGVISLFSANGAFGVMGGATGTLTNGSALGPNDLVAFLVDNDTGDVEVFINNVSRGVVNISAVADPRVFTSSGHNGYNGDITLRVDESRNPRYDYNGYLDVKPFDTVMSLNSINNGSTISIDATKQWTTLNLLSNTILSFDYGEIDINDTTQAVEFSVEIYPGLATVSWPAGVIGDTTITPEVVNLFTVVHRPAVVGMVARTYVLKVPIPNDVTDPLDMPMPQ